MELDALSNDQRGVRVCVRAPLRPRELRKEARRGALSSLSLVFTLLSLVLLRAGRGAGCEKSARVRSTTDIVSHES